MKKRNMIHHTNANDANEDYQNTTYIIKGNLRGYFL